MARPGPLIITGTVQIYRGGTAVGPVLPAHMDPPTTEQITMDGGAVFWEVEVPPNTTVYENWLLRVVTCPSNPRLVVDSATGWSISAVRNPGGLIPKTQFLVQQKVQT